MGHFKIKPRNVRFGLQSGCFLVVEKAQSVASPSAAAPSRKKLNCEPNLTGLRDALLRLLAIGDKGHRSEIKSLENQRPLQSN